MTRNPDSQVVVSRPGGLAVVPRLLWMLLAALSVGLFLAGIGPKFDELQGPCTATPAQCSDRLSPNAGELAQLKQQGVSARSFALIWTAVTVFSACVFVGTGAAIFGLNAADRGALLISLTLVLLGASAPMGDALARQYPAFQAPVAVYDFLRLITFALLFAAFPNGRIVPRAMWLVIGLWTARSLVSVFGEALPAWLASLTNAAWVALFVTGIAAQVYRYARVSTPAERKQTRWAVFGLACLTASVVVVTLVLFNQPNSQGVTLSRLQMEVALNVVILVIPATLAIAIFRNRLWDIDVVIRRTLIYGALTGLLALAYFGSVVVFQNIFSALTGQTQSTLVTVLSTLVIAALFVPLRARVQATIDHRLYRRKYHAARTLAAFGSAARDSVDLDALSEQLLVTVDETMQPDWITLWLKVP